MFTREFVHPKTKKFLGVSVYRSTLMVHEGDYFADDYRRQRCSSGYWMESTPNAAMKKAQKTIRDHLNLGYIETDESLSFRDLEKEDGTSLKFWNIRVIDDTCVINFGSYGDHPLYPNPGRWQTKYFDSADEALRYYCKSVARRLKEGYVEQHGRDTKFSQQVETQAVTAATKKKTARSKVTTAAGAREFVFQDGKSHKFWKIELDGKSHTVQYGRVGTNGQTKMKEFASDDAARKSFEKLIEQKTAKGYVEQSSTTATSKAKGTAPTKKSKKNASETNAAVSVVPPKPAPPPVVTKVTHRIDLDPKDWFWAMWRDPEPLVRPEPRPFDLEACLEAIRFSRASSSRAYWCAAKVSDVRFSPPEAEFWLTAMRLEKQHHSPRNLCKELAKKEFHGKFTAETLARHCKKGNPQACRCVADIMESDEFTDLLSALHFPVDMRWTFREFVLVYLSRPEREKARKTVEKKALESQSPKKRRRDEFSSWEIYAAMLGSTKVCEKILAQSPDSIPWYYNDPCWFLWGLGGADKVEAVADRWLKAKHWWRWSDADAHALLAHTELRRLDIMEERIFDTRYSRGETSLLRVLANTAKDPGAAPIMLRARTAGIGPDVATKWLDEQVGNGVTGLISIAAKKGEMAEAAKSYLREKQRLGFGKVIEKALKTIPREDVARLRLSTLNVPEFGPPLDGKSTPKPLRLLFEKATELTPLSGSEWADPARLPPVAVGKNRLSLEQISLLLLALQHSEFEQPHELVTAIHTHADGETLAEFVWTLFELWLAQKSPPKHKWAMRALGHLGNDDTVLKLTPLVRKWPGESQHPRAVLGLECLRAIGSEMALMQLSSIAQKLKFKALKARAAECVEEIARERGMSRDELEDRVIPDCGLDEMGRRELSFGPRSFSFVLGGDLKPMVRDEDGKVRPNPPNPGVKDDKKVANESLSEWKLIKKQIKGVAVLQSGRLEQAMITGRRWSITDFDALLVRHPLMTHLVQKLIWGLYTAKGKRTSLFRVTEERDYAGVNDETVRLDNGVTAGVVHPLEMTEAERVQWGEILSDYEIISPFPQIGRVVYSLEPGEEKATELKRFHGLQLYAPTLVFTLEKLGWIRGEAMDAGCFDEHSKQFPSADVTAVVGYEGTVAMGYVDPGEILTTESIHFCKGMRKPSGYRWGSRTMMTLGKVPDIAISEVIADLQVLRSKAK